MDLPRETAPKREIPLHTVIKITYGGVISAPIEERFKLGPDEIEEEEYPALAGGWAAVQAPRWAAGVWGPSSPYRHVLS
eukprot:720654-Pyramimonas_sp.AAC.1